MVKNKTVIFVPLTETNTKNLISDYQNLNQKIKNHGNHERKCREYVIFAYRQNKIWTN